MLDGPEFGFHGFEFASQFEGRQLPRHFRLIASEFPRALGVEVSPINLNDASELERGVAAFARSGGDALIVTASALSVIHRGLICVHRG